MAKNDDLARLRIDKSGPAAVPRKARRPLRWVAGLGVAAAALAFAWRWLLSPALTVSVAAVSQIYPTQAFTVLNASGYVVAQRKAAVASKGAGRLLWLGVEEGSVLKKGQLIARIESEDLRATEAQAEAEHARTRANGDAAQASLSNALAGWEAARANLDQAKAELDEARIDFGRQEMLLEAGVTTRAQFDAAEARFRRSRAALAASERMAEAARYTAAAARSSATAADRAVDAAAAAARAAKVNVSYTEIRAPFDGVVLTKNADVGDMITPISSAASAQAAVVTMADPSSLQVEADVSEANLGKVRVGQPCEVQLDSLPEVRFPAVVHTIVPTADRAKGTVMSKVRFLTPDPRILPEMSAKVAFLERTPRPEEQRSRTVVAPSTVTTRGGRKVVYRILGERAVETPVALGPALGDFVEVTAGLKPGDKVVQSPPAKLRDGARVKVAEE